MNISLKKLAIGLCVLLTCVKLDAIKIYLDNEGLFTQDSFSISTIDTTWEELNERIRTKYLKAGQRMGPSIFFAIHFQDTEAPISIFDNRCSWWSKPITNFLSEDAVLTHLSPAELKIKAFIPTVQKRIAPLETDTHKTTTLNASSAEITPKKECLICCNEKPIIDFFQIPVFSCKEINDEHGIATVDSNDICKECILKHLHPKKIGLYTQSIETVMLCPCCRAPLKKDLTTINSLCAEPGVDQKADFITSAELKRYGNFPVSDRLQAQAAPLQTVPFLVRPTLPDKNVMQLFEMLTQNPRNHDLYQDIFTKLIDEFMTNGPRSVKSTLNAFFKMHALTSEDWQCFINWLETLPANGIRYFILQCIKDFISLPVNFSLAINDCNFLLEISISWVNKKICLEQSPISVKKIKDLAHIQPALYESFIAQLKLKFPRYEIERLARLIFLENHDSDDISNTEKTALRNLAKALLK